MIDLYEVLGVSPNSDDVVIRAAYRAMMRKYHPDTSSAPDAEKRAKVINEAYAVLGDPARRLAYDAARGTSEQQKTKAGSSSSPPPPPPPEQPPRPSSREAAPKAPAALTAANAARRNVSFGLVALFGVLVVSHLTNKESPASSQSATTTSEEPQLPPASESALVERLRVDDVVDEPQAERPQITATPAPLPSEITPVPDTSAIVQGARSEMTERERQSLELACIMAKGEGPASYNRCLREQTEQADAAPRAPTTDRLSGAERQSLELACIMAKGQGPATYNRCLRDQLAQADAAPRAPTTDRLSSVERQSLELACIMAKGQGPATYSRCLRNQVAQAEAAPRAPKLDRLSSGERQSLELACIMAKGQGPATYNRCLRTQISELAQ